MTFRPYERLTKDELHEFLRDYRAIGLSPSATAGQRHYFGHRIDELKAEIRLREKEPE